MNTGKLDSAHVERLSEALDNVPFAKFLGIELDEIDAGVATLSFEIRPELKQNHGVVHGGAIASLIDSATAFAIISLLPTDEHATTVDLTISYLRPLTAGRARAVARVIRSGKRLIIVSAELFDDRGTLAATALSTYIKI
ncbi:MAG: PaaI family thioesterase [Acidobacteriota bacterium]|nr:PaaI family thioesterase [Acidobacteriota bacterium]